MTQTHSADADIQAETPIEHKCQKKKGTHTATTSDIIAEIKPEMLERLKAIDMPKEAYPQNGKYGKDNYRITSEKGARIEVQMKAGVFRIISSNVEAGRPNTAWKLHGGVADAWHVVKERSDW